MKKIVSLLFIGFLTNQLFSQALAKGDFDVYAGVGFGVYSLTTNDYEDNSSAAVPGLINIGASYQLSEGFALGLDYERNGFVTDADSNTRAVSQNFGVRVGYNLLNKDKNVLQPFFSVGTSNFRFDNFDDQDYIIARGTNVQIGVSWKHYFGDVVGIFLNTSIPYYSYTQFKNASGDTYEVSRLVNTTNGPKIETRILQANMLGVNFRIGMNFKF